MTWTKQAGLSEDLPELSLIPAQLLSVWGTSATDVWAVGYDGTIVHSTDLGETWPVVAPPPKEHFFAIWGTGPSDFWIGGTKGLYHYE